MGLYNMRLSSVLSFDEEQEKDIIEVVEYLNEHHKLGKLISTLIRIALENEDILYKNGGKVEKGIILKQVSESGMTYDRSRFMKSIAKDVQNMIDKVNKIYDMTHRMYMLAQVGKHLEIETKSENNLKATFILEKQLKELQETLGVSIDSAFTSNRLEATKDKADDILEYIIETYDNILNEIRNNFTIQNIPIQLPVQQIPNQQLITQQQTTQPVEHKEEKFTPQVVGHKEDINEDTPAEEFIDFGGADINILDNFFGGS